MPAHYYDEKAESCHEIIGKNGNKRATTIRDAKANGWFPSVTTVLDVLAKPQLDKWKQRQAALAAERNKRIPGEDDNTWADRVISEAFKQVEEAADLGTDIHKALEDHLQGRPYDPRFKVHVEATVEVLRAHQVIFTAHELRLVSREYGFAGTTDGAISVGMKDHRGILDFKTRKSDPKYSMTPYDGQASQIAAYHVAHYGEVPAAGMAITGANVFISTTEPGRVEVYTHDASALASAWECFHACLVLWRNFKGYDPRRAS